MKCCCVGSRLVLALLGVGLLGGLTVSLPPCPCGSTSLSVLQAEDTVGKGTDSAMFGGTPARNEESVAPQSDPKDKDPKPFPKK